MRHSAILAFVVTCALAATSYRAVPAQIELPKDTATLRVSTLPGYQRARFKCAICHSADYINFQPPGMSEAQWTGEVAKMKKAYGAPLDDEDIRLIGAYLAAAYGSAGPTK